jgi:hypothetical protein
MKLAPPRRPRLLAATAGLAFAALVPTGAALAASAPVGAFAAVPAAAVAAVPSVSAAGKPVSAAKRLVRPARKVTRRLAALGVPADADFAHPMTYVGSNPCTGEEIVFNGNINEHDHFSVDSLGALHVEQHLNFTGVSAVAKLTGVNYVNGDELDLVINLPLNNAVESYEEHVRYIRGGDRLADDDFFLVFHIHQTLRADGRVTADVADFETTCK